jgi:hypothetical protein
VRATAIYVLTRVVGGIQTIPPSDARVFSEYIFPALFERARDDSELVRLALAECLAGLAAASKRCLEFSQRLRVQATLAKRETLVEGCVVGGGCLRRPGGLTALPGGVQVL